MELLLLLLLGACAKFNFCRSVACASRCCSTAGVSGTTTLCLEVSVAKK
jgi:hypothetical protein